MNLFYVGHFTCLMCTDRLAGTHILYNLKPAHATTSILISICYGQLHMYGTIVKLNSDGGPPFISSLFWQFFNTWRMKQQLSSVTYPQTNGKAELLVKTTKRILNGYMNPQSSSDNDKWQEPSCNTPIYSTGLSPEQLLLHCQFCDFLTSQPILNRPHLEWTTAEQYYNAMIRWQRDITDILITSTLFRMVIPLVYKISSTTFGT